MDVLLFGMVAEKAGAISIDVEAGSLVELRRKLELSIPGLERLSYVIAVDRKVVLNDRALTGSEEIAVLPPFAGG
ncbi:MAG: MoaD/ThiS family protein [Flavobacteriales bacterium]|nr:MoaD/ThiS family protein [Flavobacteriales bacterium]